MLFAWLFFLLLQVAVAGTAAAAIAALVLLLRKQKGRHAWLGWVGVPFGCGILPLASTAALIASVFGWAALRPASWMFEEIFAVAPGRDFVDLKGATAPGFDSRAIYLSFEATPQTRQVLDTLLAGAQGHPKSDLLDADAMQGNAPDWWRASTWVDRHTCPRQTYRGFTGHNGWNDVIVVDCLSDGQIYVLAHDIT